MWAFCCLKVHWDNGHNEEHFRFNEHSSCETEKRKKKESAESFVRLKAVNKMTAFFSVIPKINTLLNSDLGPAHQVYAWRRSLCCHTHKPKCEVAEPPSVMRRGQKLHSCPNCPLPGFFPKRSSHSSILPCNSWHRMTRGPTSGLLCVYNEAGRQRRL